MANKKHPSNRRPTKAQLIAQEHRRRRDRRNKMVATVVVVAVVGGLVLLAILTTRSSNQKAEPIAAAANPAVTCTPDQKFDEFTDAGPHVKKAPPYETDPPSGGDHLIDPAAPGIYDAGKVDDGKVVHSLEHGYVAVWYRTGISQADLAVVENIWKSFKRDVLVMERPSLPAATPVVATAWHHRLLCSGADGAQLSSFVRTYVNKGPERIPHTVVPGGRDPRT